MLRACTALLIHSNAALFVKLNKIQLTSNWKKTPRKLKTHVSENAFTFMLAFPSQLMVCWVESEAREGSWDWEVWSRTCGMPQETSIARSEVYCTVQKFGLCSASLKLLVWSTVSCGRVGALPSVRHSGQMMDNPDRGRGLWRKGLNKQFTLCVN